MITLKTKGQIENHLACPKNTPAFAMSSTAKVPIQIDAVRERKGSIEVRTIHGLWVVIENETKVVIANEPQSERSK